MRIYRNNNLSQSRKFPQLRGMSHALLFLISLFLCNTVSFAAEIPNLDREIDLNVREQEFVDFADAFFRQVGVPLVIDETIEGTVNGRFKGTAAEVLDEVSAAFNVVTYYDGAVAYIYNANQLFTRIVSADASKSERAEQLANTMGLPDARNRLTIEASGILVNGTPRFIEQIEDLVSSFQSEPVAPPVVVKPIVRAAPEPVVPPKPVPIYKVFKLNHAWANDTTYQIGNESVTVPGVATILRDLVSEEAFTLDAARSSSAPGRGTIDGLRGRGINADTSNANQNAGTGRTLSSRGSEDIIRIVADTRINAVIIRDTADRIPAYASLIESLDVESKMVEIEATIIDINTDMSRELGVNWRFSTGDGDILFGDGTDADLGLLPDSDLITPQGRGGVLSFMLGEPTEFLARIRALEERGAANIVSKPHVITLSDVEAVLGASTEFFVRIAGNEEVDLFNVPVGTFLRVTPHVFEDDSGYRIKLLVNIEDGTQGGGQTVDSIPVVERANINTQAVINEGDSLLIGGMVREAYTKSDFRIPVLGSLPLIGRLFRSDRNSATRVERLFMITPRLANGAGFGQTKQLPSLEGSTQNILADAGKRIDSLEWPVREKQEYWPNEISGDRNVGRSDIMESNRNTVNTSKARVATDSKNLALGMNGVAPQRVLSPYSVEAWPVAGQVQ